VAAAENISGAQEAVNQPPTEDRGASRLTLSLAKSVSKTKRND